MILELLKLQHLQSIRKRKQQSISKYILPVLFLLITLAVIVVSIYYSSKAFAKLRFGEEFNTIVFLIVIVVMCIYSTLDIINRVYINSDNQDLLKMPIKKMDIFFANTISILIKQYLLCFILLFITSGIFGIVSRSDGVYYLRLLTISIFITMFSIGVGGILSIPGAWIIAFVKKHQIIRLISLVIIVGAFFYCYITFMNGIIAIIDATSQSTYINPSLVQSIKETASEYLFARLYTNILFDKELTFSYGIVVGVPIALSILAIGLTKALYYRMQSVTKENYIKVNDSIKTASPFVTLLKREYLLLMRNETESFGVVFSICSMPLMVYMTTKIVAEAAKTSLGLDIVFGVCVLTIAVFIVMGNTPASSSISRDGGASFLMNIIPYPKQKQLLIKVLSNSILTLIPFIVSMILLASFKFIDVGEFFALLFALIIFICSHTFTSVIHDAKYPEFSAYSNKSKGGQNTLLTTLIGLIIAISMGLISIFVPQFIKNEGITFLFIYLIVIIYSILTVLINKKFVWGNKK